MAKTRAALLDEHQILCADALALMERKNADYATDDDPFRNFRTFGKFGILVRLSDKLARLRTLLEKGDQCAVTDETAQDTVLDIINYAVLFEAYE